MTAPLTHSRASYKAGCRCDVCRAANAKYHREYMARSPEQVAKHLKLNTDWARRNREARRQEAEGPT